LAPGGGVTRAIGWGFIGCGDVVERKTGPAFAAVAGSRIAGVMRRDGAAAEDFARRNGVPFWTTDAQALIDRPDVGAVYIATPPEHHVDYALAACASRKPCLVEKPAGRSAEECRRMVDAFRAAGVPLYVSYYRRHLPKFRRVKALLMSGAIGTPVSIDYQLCKPAKDGDWRLSAEVNGGGHFYDLAGHVLDLLDDWFGPLTLTGSAATNVLPAHVTEDAVALTFRTRGGAVGNARWNFAAPDNRDLLVIEGTLGCLRLQAMAKSGPVQFELSPEGALRSAPSVLARAARIVRKRLDRPTRRTLRFGDVEFPHVPLLEHIAEDLERGEVASPESALRTATLMDGALAEYYGGRDGAFWQRPERFASLRQQASDRTATAAQYCLTPRQVTFFEENGFLGPLKCDGHWERLVVPVAKGRNLHLTDPDVFEVCTHPSVVNRAAQLMGRAEVSLFKSRFVVKMPGHNAEVAWHQDVGPTNGGYYPDGRPVPTLTCWLALDRVTSANGAVRVIPGTHKRLVGQFDKRIRAELVEKGDLSGEELSRAVTFELEPGEFYLFHSWLLHGSDANDSPGRRAGLNMRYAAVGDEYEEKFEYIPLVCRPART
jgi:predicted dehydrogenase